MSDQYLPHDPANWNKIEHIVCLMLENRSFDNLLGWLAADDEAYPPRGQYFNGLNTHLWNPLSNVDSDGRPFVEQVYVRRNGKPPAEGPYALAGSRRAAELYQVDFREPDPDPGEGYRDTNHQLFGVYDVDSVYPPDPTMLGFVDNYKNAMLYGTYSFGDAPTDPRTVMNCYDSSQTPVLSALAKAYAVCDEWFCSVPSQTWPNRAFAFAATSGGHVNNRPDWVIGSRTLFDQLHEAGVSWKVYSGISYNRKVRRRLPFSLTQIMISPEKARAYDDQFVLFDEFYRDLKKDTLPAYSFLEPQYSTVRSQSGRVLAHQNDQHPPSDIRSGERLIARVYQALTESKAWEKTLLIITYDEHGGSYDHVPPQKAKQPIPAELDADGRPVMVTPAGAKQPIPAKTGCYPVDPVHGFRFNRYGVRVPTVLVSPWIQEGTVARPSDYYDPALMEPGEYGSGYFDHTSIIASVRNKFGLAGCLTDRDRYAPDLSCVLTETKPRTSAIPLQPLKVKYSRADTESHLLSAITDHLSARTGIDPKKGESATEHAVRMLHELRKAQFATPPSMKLPECES